MMLDQRLNGTPAVMFAHPDTFRVTRPDCGMAVVTTPGRDAPAASTTVRPTLAAAIPNAIFEPFLARCIF
jgi:hypothetical protein